MKNPKLTDQLLVLVVVIISIIIISLGIILPKNLLPIYENNIYSYLKYPLLLVDDDINHSKSLESDIAYLYVTDDGIAISSENLENVVTGTTVEKILKQIMADNGKFEVNKRLYYYNTSKTPLVTKIAITDDSYIKSMRKSIFSSIFYVVGITYVIVTLVLLSWSNHLISKIKKLKEKIDNLNNDNYNHTLSLKTNDELYSLAVAIENMRVYLHEQEEYKNQLYQNISHDFKTPITVMKSYIEAVEDGIETKEKSFEIIKEQLNKLEQKVYSLLYLNKINYYQDKKEMLNEKYDVIKVINKSVEKFKNTRFDVKFTIETDKKNVIFRGNEDMWEAIIDNILNNFIRYAQKEIKITVKNNKIVLFNDGPNIDKNVLNNIFTPYEKGVKGIFGLGLSIVQKTLHLLNYDITIQNERKGVKFIIK